MGLMDTFGVMAESYVRHGVERGFLRKDLDTEVVAHAISALIVPGLLQALRGNFGPEQRRRYQRALMGFISDGVRAR
jgi:hypothetical protein